MNRTTLFIIALALSLSVSAQINYSNDSIRIVNAQWSVDSLDGFILKRYHFGQGELFCSPQHLFLIEIPANSPCRLAFVADTALTETSRLAQSHDALAAINGSFFDINLGNPVCFLRIDGTAVGENTPAKEDSVNRKYYQYASITLNNGRPQVIVPDSNRLWENTLLDRNIMTAGPMLLFNGQMVPQRNDRSFVTHRHNRTALGIKPNGTIILLVADGRFKEYAAGLTIPELQLIMKWLGCSDAINLDGGGSSTMYVNGKPHDGIVNYPSDNHRHDHEGQRPVSNVIIIL